MVYTDGEQGYVGLPRHEAVKHSVGEYVRGMAHTNGIESFWSLLKRGYYGTYHHYEPAASSAVRQRICRAAQPAPARHIGPDGRDGARPGIEAAPVCGSNCLPFWGNEMTMADAPTSNWRSLKESSAHTGTIQHSVCPTSRTNKVAHGTLLVASTA